VWFVCNAAQTDQSGMHVVKHAHTLIYTAIKLPICFHQNSQCCNCVRAFKQNQHSFHEILAAICCAKHGVSNLFTPYTEHCGGVQMLHLHGVAQRCKHVSTLLQTVLFWLHSGKYTNI